jgi:hypothetical protein
MEHKHEHEILNSSDEFKELLEKSIKIRNDFLAIKKVPKSESQFSCTYPKCERAYSTKFHLERHLRTHVRK